MATLHTPYKLLSGALVGVCLLLALATAWQPALRNAASLYLLRDPDASIEAAPAARPYLRGVVALNRGEAALALQLLEQADGDSQLVRAERARALARATGDWHTAAALLATEQPLPRFLLQEMLQPHIAALGPAELAFWREQLRHVDPVLLIELALELLVQGKYDEAQEWAHALPGYAASPEAKRIVAQAHLNRGQYGDAVVLFQELYAQDGSALNAYWYGRALLLDGRYEESIAALEQAVAATDQHLAWYLADLGLAYGLAGRCVQAAPTVDLALTHDTSTDLIDRVAQVRETIAAHCP